MLAGPDQHVLVAGIDADEAAHALGVVGLGLAVAENAEQFERHLAHRPAGIAEGERKVAIDAVPHGAAFGAHQQRLGNGEIAVFGNHHVRIEGADDFGSVCLPGAQQRAKQDDDAQKPAHRGARSTCGTARSPASDSSK